MATTNSGEQDELVCPHGRPVSLGPCFLCELDEEES